MNLEEQEITLRRKWINEAQSWKGFLKGQDCKKRRVVMEKGEERVYYLVKRVRSSCDSVANYS